MLHKLFNVSEKLFPAQALALLLRFTKGHECALETEQPHLSCIIAESITKPGHEPNTEQVLPSNMDLPTGYATSLQQTSNEGMEEIVESRQGLSALMTSSEEQ
ncbi:hypothetical protein KSC_028340 [Ktedonobacter sp. SOSP1-52]|nr:hypothetical protein KSC_028340 [Ktedonobacter sp. SOSP1-52]